MKKSKTLLTFLVLISMFFTLTSWKNNSESTSGHNISENRSKLLEKKFHTKNELSNGTYFWYGTNVRISGVSIRENYFNLTNLANNFKKKFTKKNYRVKTRRKFEQKSYIISGVSKVYSGNKQDFERALWKGLSKRVIIVGPFESQKEAMNSSMLYRRNASKIKEIPSATNPKKIYWFPIKFEESERLKIYVMQRTPATVQEGSTNFFIKILYEQLGFMQFSIGPFWSQDQANVAKGIYVRNE